jgi:hypothetical protein
VFPPFKAPRNGSLFPSGREPWPRAEKSIISHAAKFVNRKNAQKFNLITPESSAIFRLAFLKNF